TIAFRSVARRVLASPRRQRVPSPDRDRARRAGRARGRARRGVARPPASLMVNVGLTLPSFVDDPEVPLAVAHAAEAAGLDAVFVYQHVWRGEPPETPAPRAYV